MLNIKDKKDKYIDATMNDTVQLIQQSVTPLLVTNKKYWDGRTDGWTT